MSQFTVQHIWPLDPTQRSGGFQGADGFNYYCPIGAYHLLVKGATYDAETREHISKAGKKSFIVNEKFHPPAALVGAAGSNTTPPTQSPPGASVAPPPNVHLPSTRRQADPKDVLIFVTGVVGRSMGSGSFGVTDIDLLTKAALAAYRDNLA